MEKWARMLKILGRGEANTRLLGTFFNVVVQVVLLFGLDMWLMNPCMGWALGGFQHMVARRITRRHPWKLQDESWEYSPLEEAIREDVLEEVEVYFLMIQNTVAQYIEI